MTKFDTVRFAWVSDVAASVGFDAKRRGLRRRFGGRRRTEAVSACVYCGSTVENHDPVYVAKGSPDADPSPFCNYACLSAYVEAEGLLDGASCEWSPS